MQTSAPMKIHPSRLEQLKRLAKTYGPNVSITDCLERLIREKTFAGTLPDELPGFELQAHAGHVFFTVDGLGLPAMQPRDAMFLRAAILKLLEGAKNDERFGIALPDDMALAVARAGNGYVMKISDEVAAQERKVSLTKGMMLDLSRQLEAHAVQAVAARK